MVVDLATENVNCELKYMVVKYENGNLYVYTNLMNLFNNHCCPLVLIVDMIQIWQDPCHIWKYYIIKCYKMLVIFTYNDKR